GGVPRPTTTPGPRGRSRPPDCRPSRPGCCGRSGGAAADPPRPAQTLRPSRGRGPGRAEPSRPDRAGGGVRDRAGGGVRSATLPPDRRSGRARAGTGSERADGADDLAAEPNTAAAVRVEAQPIDLPAAVLCVLGEDPPRGV